MNKIPTQEKIDTCVESRDKLKSRKSEYRRRIYQYMDLNGGATCDEIEVALDMRHQTASCFIRFMVQDGELEPTPERKITRAGRKAIVWKIRNKEVAKDLFDR